MCAFANNVREQAQSDTIVLAAPTLGPLEQALSDTGGAVFVFDDHAFYLRTPRIRQCLARAHPYPTDDAGARHDSNEYFVVVAAGAQRRKHVRFVYGVSELVGERRNAFRVTVERFA